MLDNKVQAKATQLFKLGHSDAFVARELESDYQQINKFRKQLSISKEMVFEYRHKHWVALLKQGKSTQEIADQYGMTERSVRVTLWDKKKDFSFVKLRHAPVKKKL